MDKVDLNGWDLDSILAITWQAYEFGFKKGAKNELAIIAKRDKEIQDWIQPRIDHWEDVYEKSEGPTEGSSGIKDWERGYDEGEAEGMKTAFYMVHEFISGQRK